MLRRLSAIEIAEGALLADICVIFQLLVTYLPVGGDFFRVLIFVVFAILVLRRGLYVGIMAMFVALFITGIVTGPFAHCDNVVRVHRGLVSGHHYEASNAYNLVALSGNYGWCIRGLYAYTG